MLEIRDLSVFYGQHRAVEEVSVTVSRGEIVVMLGANGAGKSSVLRAAAGLLPVMNNAAILMDGRDISHCPADEFVEAGIALVPEDRAIFADLTVLENLKLGAYPKRARQKERENLENVMSLFPKLEERRRQKVRSMSGGEQQMVAIGRAMMSAPAILLLDEPSLGLSPLLCGELFRSLAVIRSAEIGILLVEQNAKRGLAIADRGYVLENGRVTGSESSEILSSDERVRKAYLGGD
ncbi:MAG TPA: ABC transporter ATP-binding protein [Gemmatimonadetes bacterium]|nr:ABC transporter ATP-binding protein [Gemmatimonadota bacterium]